MNAEVWGKARCIFTQSATAGVLLFKCIYELQDTAVRKPPHKAQIAQWRFVTMSKNKNRCQLNDIEVEAVTLFTSDAP